MSLEFLNFSGIVNCITMLLNRSPCLCICLYTAQLWRHWNQKSTHWLTGWLRDKVDHLFLMLIWSRIASFLSLFTDFGLKGGNCFYFWQSWGNRESSDPFLLRAYILIANSLQYRVKFMIVRTIYLKGNSVYKK